MGTIGQLILVRLVQPATKISFATFQFCLIFGGLGNMIIRIRLVQQIYFPVMAGLHPYKRHGSKLPTEWVKSCNKIIGYMLG